MWREEEAPSETFLVNAVDTDTAIARLRGKSKPDPQQCGSER